MIFGFEWYWILGYIAVGVADTFLLRSFLNAHNITFEYRITSLINRSIGYLLISWIPVINFSTMLIMSFIWWIQASMDTTSNSWYNKRIIRTKK